jgi:hypothetical protein
MRGLHLWILAVTIGQQPWTGNVRGTEPLIQSLITDGLRRSETFAGLVAAMNDSDLIVYIEFRVTRDGLGGFVPHAISIAGGYRYLRLVVSRIGRRDRLIAVIAHELQHAVEVAKDPRIGRSRSIVSLFEQIGFRHGCPMGCFETIEAMDVERRVADELSR